MLFNSLTFLVFLPLVFGLYWAIGARRRRLQNAFIWIASYVFYGWWDWRFLTLIFVSSLVDYAIGRGLGRAEDPRRRKILLATSLAVNLGLLGFFKYFGFFTESAIVALQAIGFNPDPITLQVILPMGISFYTFQTLSYTIDIYRRQLKPTEDVIAFLAFVSFFPQLVAGPIERARALLPQFERVRTFDPVKARDGAHQLLWGFVKKVLVADNLAPYVEQVFNNHQSMDSVSLFCGITLFTVQVYCDFSGYSDMAIGTARLFGINLSQNFAYPLFARTISEFWRRWHISLSTWFRDYIYFPLGGSLGTPGRTIFNVLVVFGVSGLWHGATWTFVLWGLLNGAYFIPSILMGSDAPRGTVAPGRMLPTPREMFGMLRTTALFGFGLIFFRADDWTHALGYIARLATAGGDLAAVHGFIVPLAVSAALIAVEWTQRTEQHGFAIERVPVVVRWGLHATLGLLLLVFGSVASREFVYFQF